MITIRDAKKADAGRLLAIYDYYVRNTAVTFEYVTPSLQEFEKRMERIEAFYPYLVIERDGVTEGYAYAGVFKDRAAYDWSCETTIYLDRAARRHGLGEILYQALETKLAAMGILNMYACIGYPETEDEYLTRDSALFHERFGFRKIGEFHKCGYKFGRWYDMIWMEKTIGEHRKDCPAVRRYAGPRPEQQNSSEGAAPEDVTLAAYKPEYRDLWFRKKLIEDEQTMSYNHAWGGTVAFPEEKWKSWFDHWIAEPEEKRYYRYIAAVPGGFVGEIAYHYDEELTGYAANVIIHAEYRGRGYGSRALDILCSAAKENGIAALYDDIACDNPAVGLFLRHGFREEYRTAEKIILKKDL